ncbi:MAG: hypothetical protein Q8Q48_02145, partial [Candidatus Staskawiczbacteria bacterium]|nr:hypothetical protein [Candidatus Staskawiczbacteria bacterium]
SFVIPPFLVGCKGSVPMFETISNDNLLYVNPILMSTHVIQRGRYLNLLLKLAILYKYAK